VDFNGNRRPLKNIFKSNPHFCHENLARKGHTFNLMKMECSKSEHGARARFLFFRMDQKKKDLKKRPVKRPAFFDFGFQIVLKGNFEMRFGIPEMLGPKVVYGGLSRQ
jgi:hypothetical protein